MSKLEREWPDIQGNILRPYAQPYARYVVLQVVAGAGARRVLSHLLRQRLVTTAERWAPGDKPHSMLNVAISWHGLRALGVAPESLESFPQEFQQGMATRWQMLRDPDPQTWEFGAEMSLSHVLVTVHGSSASHADAQLQTLRDACTLENGALVETHVQYAAMLNRGTEHFGFADGFSQPQVDGSGAPAYRGDGAPVDANGWRPIATGEFLLGHQNETGFPGPALVPAQLGHNGSYAAYRKIEQDVPAFRAFLRDESARIYGLSTPEHVERLAAKIVGRWRSGCPLQLSPEHDDASMADQWGLNNDFRYEADARGAVCPLGSHIRRMNPRDGLSHDSATLVSTHRIMRRGMPYGDWLESDEADTHSRGIAFMAINASLRYQFELVHRDWSNSGEFAGLDAADVDPLVGEPRAGSRFRVPQVIGASKRIHNLRRFSTLRGGGYFFIPSITALRLIAAPNGNGNHDLS